MSPWASMAWLTIPAAVWLAVRDGNWERWNAKVERVWSWVLDGFR